MTIGFYATLEEKLCYGPNFISTPNFELLKENKDDYQYPMDGWYWFDSEEEARIFFNLPEEEQPPIIE